MEPAQASKMDLRWESADDEAREQEGGIEEAIKFAEWNADQGDRWEASQEEFIQRVQDGAAAWGRLKQETGFDLRGVFRRRALVPFVLVPRKVFMKHKSAEKMRRNLKQAHDAFIFGTPYAALALMRSVMEAVLRDHYGADGGDLSELIRDANDHLPRQANQAALHRLRKLANASLHLGPERDEGLASVDEVRLEKDILGLLFVLRALIEGVK